MINESDLCIICQKVSTTARNERNEPLCASCSNKQYSADIMAGRIVVLKLDMTKVKQSTLLQIQALIQKDIENYKL